VGNHIDDLKNVGSENRRGIADRRVIEERVRMDSARLHREKAPGIDGFD